MSNEFEQTTPTTTELVSTPKKRGRPRKDKSQAALIAPVLTDTVATEPSSVEASSFISTMTSEKQSVEKPQENLVPSVTASPVVAAPSISLTEDFAKLGHDIEQDVSNIVSHTKAVVVKKAATINMIFMALGLAFFVVMFFVYRSMTASTQLPVETIAGEPVIESVSTNTVTAKSSEPVVSIVEQTQAPIALQMSRKLEDSIAFADGATRLGPLGKRQAQEVYATLKPETEQLFLYGYSGRFKDKERQYNLARARAISTKIFMVNELGANPKDITVVEPKFYINNEPYPENVKQVKTVIRSKQ